MKTGKGILKNTWLYLSILVLVILAGYYKIFAAGFISWDDAGYTILNKDIHSWSFENVCKWFSNFYTGNYHPLTIFSYAIDYAIGKQDASVYHTVNIVLHTMNAALLFAFVKKIQSNTSVAFFVAMLFAIHPVQTESVSWVAERKNVLSGFFYLLALWSYAGYVSENSKRKYILVIAAAIAAMLSKATAVSLPLSLFAVDIWMRRPLKNKKALLEKLPLFLLAIPIGIIAVRAQGDGGFLSIHKSASAFETVVFAGYSYVQYIVHFLFPVRLSVIYPYPEDIGVMHIVFSLMALGLLWFMYYSYKKGWNMLCGGIVFYSVNIVFVLQFIQFGNVLMADRYLYIACIGILIPLVCGVFQWVQKYKFNIGLWFCSIACAACLYLTYLRNDIWLSEENFWTSIVKTFPNSAVAQSSIGGVYLNEGDYERALVHIDRALSIDAGNYMVWYNKGLVYLRQGKANLALLALNKAISINEYTKALFTRAIIYNQLRQYSKCCDDIEKVLQQEPRNARAYYMRGSCMEEQNDLPAALINYNEAVRHDASEGLFYLRRGIVETKLGQAGNAVNDLSIVIESTPRNAMAWYWRGIAKYNCGQMPCDDFEHAEKLGFKQATEAIQKICKTN